MTPKEYKKLKAFTNKLVDRLKELAFEEGVDPTTSEFELELEKIVENYIIERNYSYNEFKLIEKAIAEGKSLEDSEVLYIPELAKMTKENREKMIADLETKIENIKNTFSEDLSNLKKEYDAKLSTIDSLENKLKNINSIAEKALSNSKNIQTVINTKEIVKELDTTKLDETTQDIKILQSDFLDLYNRVGQIKIPEIKDWSKEIKDLDWRIDNIRLKGRVNHTMADAGSFNNAILDTRYYKKGEVNSSFIPYSGANTNLDLGVHNIISAVGRFTTGIYDNATTPIISIDAGNRTLKATALLTSLDWINRATYDTGANTTIDWQACQLWKLGSVVADWATTKTFKVTDTLSLQGATSGYVGLKGAAAAGSTTYTLPAADGTARYSLKTDAAGTMSWGSSIATCVIAAYDAPDITKATATYICDGTDDDVQINAAWAAGFKHIILSEGSFNCGDSIVLPNSTGLILEGQGVYGTYVAINHGTGAQRWESINKDLIIWNNNVTPFKGFFYLKNMFLNGWYRAAWSGVGVPSAAYTKVDCLWRITGQVKGTNTDAEGKLYGKVVAGVAIEFYKDSALSSLVAHTGAIAAGGLTAVIADNSSGLGGYIGIVTVPTLAETFQIVGNWATLETAVAAPSSYTKITNFANITCLPYNLWVTVAAGPILNFYANPNRTTLVAHTGVIAGAGAIDVIADASSGIGGTVTCAVVPTAGEVFEIVTTWTGCGFKADNTLSDSTVRDVMFMYFPSTELKIGKPWGWVVTDSIFENTGMDGIWLNSADTHGKVSNCKIIQCDGMGLRMDGYNMMVTNCEFKPGDSNKVSGSTPLYRDGVAGLLLTTAGTNTVGYHTVTNCQFNSSQNNYGIYIANGGMNAITNCDFIDNATVTGDTAIYVGTSYNNIMNCNTAGYTTGINLATSSNTVIGGYHGDTTGVSMGSYRNKVIGGTFISCTTGVISTSYYNLVANNYFYGCTTSLNLSTSSCDYGSITGNIFESATTAVNIASGADYNTFTGNNFHDSPGAITDASSYTIWEGNYGVPNRRPPSAAQAITGVGSTILANENMIVLNPDGDYTLTSTPTIADGKAGQVLIITCASAEANTVTVQDQDTLANSNLQLGAATRAISGKDSLTLVFDGTDWIETGFTNN